MQLPWKYGRIRLKNTREGASPTRSSPKDGEGFAIWLAIYRERLQQICKGAEPARTESREWKGTV